MSMDSKKATLNPYAELFSQNAVPAEIIALLERYLEQGYLFEELNYIYGVSRLLKIPMEELFSPATGQCAQEIANHATELPPGARLVRMNPNVVTEYMNANELTSEQMSEKFEESIQYQIQQRIPAPITTPAQAALAGTEPEDPVLPKEYVDAPFSYNELGNEQVVLNTGALIYTIMDFNVPGRGGLDLSIRRRYNSSQANDADFDLDREYVRTVDQSYYLYSGVIWCNIYYSYPSTIPPQIFTVGTFSGTADTYADYNNYIVSLRNQYKTTTKTEGIFPNIYTVTTSYNIITTSFNDVVYNSYNIYRGVPVAKENNHLQQAYGLGYGWSLCLPSVESTFYYDSDGTKIARRYLHLEDGCVYQISDKMNASSTNLINYPRKDLWLRDSSGTLQLPHGGTANYQYILEHKDGKKDYLNSQTIVATQDRFKNTISYSFTKNGGATIKDSVGNIYNLIKKVTQGSDYTLTWSGLPGSRQIVYTIKSKKLEEDKDQVGQTRIYSYDSNSIIHPSQHADVPSCQINYCNLTKITHPSGAETVYEYDTVGGGAYLQYRRYALKSRKDSEYNWSGNEKMFSFTCPDSRITEAKVTLADGSDSEKYPVLTYTFNNKHQRDSEIRKHGEDMVSSKAYEYEYGLVKKEIMTAPFEQTIEWNYNERGDLNYSIDAEGNQTDYQFDNTCSLPLVKTYSMDDSVVEEEFELNNTNTTIKKARVYETKGNTRSLKQLMVYEYDSYGNPTKEHRYYGNLSKEDTCYTTTSTYKSGAFLTEKKTEGVKDADGVLIKSRGGAGIVLESMDCDNYGRVSSKTDPNGNKISYEYDGLGRLTKETYPDGGIKETLYEVNTTGLNQLTVTDLEGTAVKRKMQNRYTPLGRLDKVYDMLANTLRESFEYDNMARPKEERKHYPDKDWTIKNKTIYDYDSFGRITEKVISDKNSKELYRESVAYDDANRKETTTIHGDSYAASIVKTVHKDKLGQVETQVIAGAETSFAYDSQGNKTKEINPLGKTTSWSYNHTGQVTMETNALGETMGAYYDELGNKTKSYDRANNTSIYTYDALGRLLTQKTPFEKQNNTIYYAEARYGYDPNGNVIEEKLSCGLPGEAESWRQTSHSYNSRNLLMETASHGDNETVYSSYTYDTLGNKTRSYQGKPGDASVVEYQYNPLGKVEKIIDALGRAETFAYDNSGMLKNKVDRCGNITVYEFDGLERILSETVTSKDGQPNGHRSFTYTKTGEKCTAANGEFSATCRYNARGLLESETETGGVVKSYTYDECGRRKTFVLKKNGAEQISMNYDYDGLGRLEHVYKNKDKIATYAYGKNGNRESLTYPNGTNVVYGYNLANLVTSLDNRRNNTSFLSCEYTYSLDGNQVSKIENGKTTHYRYDRLGRLEIEENDQRKWEYQYDRYGNRESMRVTGEENAVTTYEYDINNRLLAERKEQGAITEVTKYRYDANGNLRAQDKGIFAPRKEYQPGTVGFGGDIECFRLMRYNGFNQQVAVCLDGMEASYTYRPDGLRHSKTVNGAVTTHTWDGSQMVAESAGISQRSYLRGLNLIAREWDGAREYYHHNAHGDVVCLTGGGAVTRQYSYDAFGVEQDKSAGDTNPFRYCAEYLDKESGCIYLRARYYAPDIGRFTQRDTVETASRTLLNGLEIADPLSLNLYVYCYGNPVLYQDFSGNFAISALAISVGASALAGFVVGAGFNLVTQSFSKGWSNVNWAEVGINAAAGLFTGALSGTKIGIPVLAGINAAVGSAVYLGTQWVNNGQISLGGFAASFVLGGIGGAFGGNGSKTISDIARLQLSRRMAQAAGYTWGMEIITGTIAKTAVNAFASSAWRSGLSNVATYLVPAVFDIVTSLPNKTPTYSLPMYTPATSNHTYQGPAFVNSYVQPYFDSLQYSWYLNQLVAGGLTYA